MINPNSVTRLILILLLLVCRISTASAQNFKYRFSHLDISNGLSHNQVNCIFKDSEGFMWFGTMSGLNRYDGYTFKVFKHRANDNSSLNDDYIRNIFEGPGRNLWITTPTGICIYNFATEKFDNDISEWLRKLNIPDPNIIKIKKDSQGCFWFLCADSGLYKYNPIDNQTQHYSSDTKSTLHIYSNNISDFSEDKNGNIWLVYSSGILETLNTKINRIIYHSNKLNKTINKNLCYSITVDSDIDIWLYASNGNMGVYYFNPGSNKVKHIDKDSSGPRLNANIINNVVQADDGMIWVATDHGGINLIDKKSFNVIYLLNREDDTKSLRQNSVILYKDISGIMWAGTFKEGISYYHKNLIRFPLYKHFAADPTSLNFEDVDKFAEDKKGNLWIGTNGGGLIYFNRKTGKYTQYKNDPINGNSLSNDIVISLYIDHNQTLWIGTYYGGLDSFDGTTFIHHKHSDKLAESITDDRVWSLLEDSSGNLWVGTFGGGVNKFNLSRKIFSHPFKQTDVRSPLVTALFEDRDKNLWICGYSGIDVILKKTKKIIHFIHDNTSNSLVANNVNGIVQDSRGLIWIATRYGVSILNLATGKFITLTGNSGLPDNNILNILEDNNGKMWLSSSKGLSRVTLITKKSGYTFQFENFDETDGLQGREFNENAALKTTKGELIFGGGHGFNIFNPLSIQPNLDRFKLVFTNFQLFNRDVTVNNAVDRHTVLSAAISETKSITLHHNDNVFTIEFAALNFLNAKVKYLYMLDGFDKGWIIADGNIRKATYTNLDGGEYTFKVKAINLDAPWITDSISLKITVLPPFWKSTFAYILYFIIISGVLLLIRQRSIQKIRRKLHIEQQKKEVERMYEVEKLKTKFLTNVSHEFRTPISLIIAPVDKMLQAADADQKQQLNMVRKNAWRLLNLVNQLLDFRKMEVRELKLHVRTGDIIKFVKDTTLSFNDIAEEKGIVFIFDTEIEHLITKFDHDKIERILFNLLSNAFKFTQSGGHVSVLLSLTSEKSEEPSRFIEIKVIDTGIGISLDDKRSRIFDRFFQNDLPDSIINQGSGIGLAITKEFVNMHQGEIFVESEPGHGSCFTVRLPLQDLIEEEPASNRTADKQHIKEKATIENDNNSKRILKANEKQTVLLVEDNDDFRFYLKDNLKEIFHIIEGVNGKEGWQKALAIHPDIIVSDISMPEMNGMDLCRKIKNDSRTSHIPIILLTALMGQEEELKGLEIGANDYMTKPFNFEILISKIKNLLQLKATLKKTYTRHLDFQLNETIIPSEDEKFVRDVVQHIDQNMLNPSLSVNELSKHMGMNRNTLYKKLLLITGKSPVEYIRSLRLKKAAHLLLNSQMTIAEVSYEVGFNTPHYFTKSFKEEFNILPSEFIHQNRKQTQEKLASPHEV